MLQTYYVQLFGLLLAAIAAAVLLIVYSEKNELSEIVFNPSKAGYKGPVVGIIFFGGIMLIVLPLIFTSPNDNPAPEIENTSREDKNTSGSEISTSGNRPQNSCKGILFDNIDNSEVNREDDDDVIIISSSEAEERTNGEKAPGIGWSYYGRFGGNLWITQNFSDGSGIHGLPRKGDKLTANTNVSLRKGPKDYTIVGWKNRKSIGTICSGYRVTVTYIRVLKDNFYWIKIQTDIDKIDY